MKRSLLIAAVLCFLSNNTFADWIDCTPIRIAVKPDVIHLGCKNDAKWYGVKYTKDNIEFVNRILSVAATAVVASKGVKLDINRSQSGDWRDIRSIEMFQ